jgi:hypothetical protein
MVENACPMAPGPTGALFIEVLHTGYLAIHGGEEARRCSTYRRRTQSRPFAAIEEALLIRERVQGLGLSQHEVARRRGRDVSWVSRRLQLLSGLPDAVAVVVIEGRLSS